MKQLNWCSTAQDAAYMRQRQFENKARSISNRNENWFAELLLDAGLQFNRQIIWGYRLFDFWSHQLGIAVEIDGEEHDPNYDAYRDEYNFRRSAIVVLRVRNQNQDDAESALDFIRSSPTKAQRRIQIGIDGGSKWLFTQPYPPSFLKAFLKGEFP